MMMRWPPIIYGRRLLQEAELHSLGYVLERLADGVDGNRESVAAD